MTLAAPVIAWPLAGRILTAIGGHTLAAPRLCRRTRTGVEFQPVPAGIDDWLIPILGAGRWPAQLSLRPGELFGDFLLLNSPNVDALLARLGEHVVVYVALPQAKMRDQLRRLALSAELAGSTVSGLPWPPDPAAVPVTIPIEELVLWTHDPATGCACHIGGTLLCDVRRLATGCPNRQTDPTSDPSTPASSKRHPMNPWLLTEVRQRRNRGVPLRPDKATAETLLKAWEHRHGTAPLIGEERDKRLRAIVERLRDWLS